MKAHRKISMGFLFYSLDLDQARKHGIKMKTRWGCAISCRTYGANYMIGPILIQWYCPDGTSDISYM